MLDWIKNYFHQEDKTKNNREQHVIDEFRKLPKDERGSYLFFILYKDDIETLRIIINEINPNERVKTRETDVHILIAAMNYEAINCCNLLIDKDIILLDEIDPQTGNNALIKALHLRENNFIVSEIIKKLIIKFRSRINYCNNQGIYPLQLVMQRGDFTLVELCLDKGAKPSLIKNLVHLIDKNKKNYGYYKTLMQSHDVNLNYKFMELDYYGLDYQKDPIIFFDNKGKSLREALKIKNNYVLGLIKENLVHDKKVNTILMNFILMIKKAFPTVDDQLLIPLIKEYTNRSYIMLTDMDVEFIVDLLRFYKPKRVIKLLSNFSTQHNEYGFLRNASIAYKKVKQIQSYNELITILPKKPKSFEHVLSKITLFILKMEQENFPLFQDRVLSWENEKIEEFSISIPKYNYDLILLGTKLNNCVGNGFYSAKVRKMDCYVMSLNLNKKPVFCIEFNALGIIQARGKNNQGLPDNLYRKIEMHITNHFFNFEDLVNKK